MDETYDYFDIDNLEITSKSVERTLEPLLEQVDVFINQKHFSTRKKGYSKQADTILKSLDDMIKEYLTKGERIKNEAPDRQSDCRAALDDVKRSGKELYKCAQSFLEDCCDINKRKLVMNATKAMLSSVTRLMILADIIDVLILLRLAHQVENGINGIKNSMDHQTLMDNWKKFGVQICHFMDLAGYRQQDLIDERKRMKIGAARGMLLQHIPMLLTTSKTYIRHPELASAKANRDYTIKSIMDAIHMINSANKGGSTNEQMIFYEKPGELAMALDEFDKHAIIRADNYSESEGRNLDNRLKQIVTNCNVLVSSPCTRAINKEGIEKCCETARLNLQQLIGAYKNCKERGERNNDSVRSAQNNLLQVTDKLREYLKRAVVDHVSDNFQDTDEYIKLLVNAAASGNEDQVESTVPYIEDSISRILEVSQLACSVSNNYEAVQMTRLASHHVEQLCPELATASRCLVLRPSSKLAQENMVVFKNELVKSLNLLSNSVDCLLNIWDQLTMLESHIRDDIALCLTEFQNGNMDGVLENLKILSHRANRVLSATRGEMTNFQRDSEYRIQVEAALDDLEELLNGEFNEITSEMIEKMKRNGGKLSDNDLKKLEDVMKSVSTCVHDVWRSVVFGRDQSGYETDVSDRLDGRKSSQENLEEVKPSTEDREAMRILSGQHKEVLDREMAGFLEQRKRLLHEMTKWDESGNQLVVLAKQICKVLLEMTEFTRGQGPLQSTMDVIQSASRISDFGKEFNTLANQIAIQCPNSATKNDLERYIERVTLYCHQIKITSKVKADIQNVGGEIIVSGLDSVTSLIEAGKNLMAAVVETVKSCYIASTKYSKRTQVSDSNNIQFDNKSGSNPVQWRMKAPKKKPLINIPDSDDDGDDNRVRRSHRAGREINPGQELDQFG